MDACPIMDRRGAARCEWVKSLRAREGPLPLNQGSVINEKKTRQVSMIDLSHLKFGYVTAALYYVALGWALTYLGNRSYIMVSKYSNSIYNSELLQVDVAGDKKCEISQKSPFYSPFLFFFSFFFIQENEHFSLLLREISGERDRCILGNCRFVLLTWPSYHCGQLEEKCLLVEWLSPMLALPNAVIPRLIPDCAQSVVRVIVSVSLHYPVNWETAHMP